MTLLGYLKNLFSSNHSYRFVFKFSESQSRKQKSNVPSSKNKCIKHRYTKHRYTHVKHLWKDVKPYKPTD